MTATAAAKGCGFRLLPPPKGTRVVECAVGVTEVDRPGVLSGPTTATGGGGGGEGGGVVVGVVVALVGAAAAAAAAGGALWSVSVRAIVSLLPGVVSAVPMVAGGTGGCGGWCGSCR